jgi:hypothetical protein
VYEDEFRVLYLGLRPAQELKTGSNKTDAATAAERMIRMKLSKLFNVDILPSRHQLRETSAEILDTSPNGSWIVLLLRCP